MPMRIYPVWLPQTPQYNTLQYIEEHAKRVSLYGACHPTVGDFRSNRAG